MSKMNQKFIEEFGSGFTKTIEDFTDDDYQYKKWLLDVQPDSDKPITMEDLDKWKTMSDKQWDQYPGLSKPINVPYNELGL